MTRRERAEALEREAERFNNLEMWTVASDAWLEAGDPTRAWYARLRAREPFGTTVTRLITRQRAEEIAQKLETYRTSHGVRNEDRGALELFRFMALQPDRLYAYYDPIEDQRGPSSFHVGDGIRTFVGDYLGTVVHRGRITHPFGNPNARLLHVRVRAINGYIYRGTCSLDGGTYCKLRRGGPWLR